MKEEIQSDIRRTPKDVYAKTIGVSRNVLGTMLNKEFFADLQKVGYQKSQKYLTHKQIVVLEEKCVNLHL